MIPTLVSHNRDFLYEPRGFTNIQEHDTQIIKNWNEIISYDDDVYHLGDVMLNDNEYGLKCLKQLNGRIHIICGNHDTEARRALYEDCYNVVEVVDGKYLKYGKYRFFLTHYPCICANKDDDKPLKARLVGLCGHSHAQDKWANWDNGIIYHCELDCHNNTPVSIEQIIEELKGKVKEQNDSNNSL